MTRQLTILKLMAKLDTDTAIVFLRELSDEKFDVNDDYARIVMYCNDLLGMYRPTNNDNAPWIDVRDKIANMDLANGYDDTDLVINSLVQNMDSNQLALLRTLADSRGDDYVRGALSLFRHLGWKD